MTHFDVVVCWYFATLWLLIWLLIEDCEATIPASLRIRLVVYIILTSTGIHRFARQQFHFDSWMKLNSSISMFFCSQYSTKFFVILIINSVLESVDWQKSTQNVMQPVEMSTKISPLSMFSNCFDALTNEQRLIFIYINRF